MSETLQRQWMILRAIPRGPGTIDADSLVSNLNTAGYQVDKRIVLRDLKALSRIFPLRRDSAGTPDGWSWLADAPAIDLPMMDGPAALSLRMIEQSFPALIPPGMDEVLAPEFARARAVLAAHPNHETIARSDCTFVVRHEMPLEAPKANKEAARAVFQAVLERKRMRVSYATPGPDVESASEYEVNPLGLLVQGRVIYLICTIGNAPDISRLALHRLKDVRVTGLEATRPAQFDLDEYFALEESRATAGPMIELRARFECHLVAHLYETPLSADQVIEYAAAGQVIVTATVRDTPQLAAWLLGFGEFAEVLRPESVRQNIERSQRIAALRYRRR
jgi:predicted DNA-binding transcriptional regulator YafY